MDAKNIYIACQAMMRRAEWERRTPDSEWSYIGAGDEFDVEAAQRNIDEYFPEEAVFFVTDRHDSSAIERARTAEAVKKAIRQIDATVCDKAFSRFMVFSSLGVFKRGAAI